MNLPSKDQVVAFGRHIVTAAASVIGTLAMMKVISAGDASSLQTSLDQISHGTAEVMTGVAGLVAAISAAYAAVSASPLWQLFRGSAAVAADPAKIAKLRAASITNKAPIAALTDEMPEVAHVNTMPTPGGRDLAMAVPSTTVRPVTTIN